jgi:intein-encoded DNA endonuclease-like protein
MKTYNVYVPDDQERFIRELLNKLGFKWSLSLSDDKASKNSAKEESRNYELDEEARKKAAKVREESLKDVINRIEEMRKGNH